MAWAFVGVSAAPTDVTATSHVIAMPAGTQAGDLLIACISSRTANTTSITLPAGWTLVAEQKAGNTTAAATTSTSTGMMAWRIRGSADPSAGERTFTHPIAPSIAIGRILAYRDANIGTPVNTQASTTTTTNITSVSVTGMTTTLANTLVVSMVAGGRNAAWSGFNATDPAGVSGATDVTSTVSSTWRERCDSLTTTGADTSLAVADALKASIGATGNLLAVSSVAGGQVLIAGAFNISVASGVSIYTRLGFGGYGVDRTGSFAGKIPTFYSMPADPAAFTLSGKDAGLKYGRVLTAVKGTFTLSGKDATLRYARVMPAAKGTFTLSGQLAGLKYGHFLTAEKGTFTLSGQAATLRYGHVLTAVKATFTLSGQDAGLRAARKLTTEPGTFALTGYAVNLVYSGAGDKTLIASPASFALTGQTVTLTYVPSLTDYVMTAGTGEFLVRGGGPPTTIVDEDGNAILDEDGNVIIDAGDGFETILRAARQLHVTTGAFALTGNSAVLRVTRQLSAITGAFTLSGQAAALKYGRGFPALTGAFTLSGKIAALRSARKVYAITGAFALTGYPVNLTYSGSGSKTLIASPASFTLSGQAATLRSTRVMLAVKGTFTLTGQTAGLKFARQLAAGKGTFTLTGQAANLVYTPAAVGIVMPAATGAFVLTGKDANLVWSGADQVVMSAEPGAFTVSGISATRFIIGRRPTSRVLPSIRDYGWYKQRPPFKKLGRK